MKHKPQQMNTSWIFTLKHVSQNIFYLHFDVVLYFEWEERRQRINMHYTVYPQTAGEIFKVSGMHPFSQ